MLTVGAVVAFVVQLLLVAATPAATSAAEVPAVVQIALKATRWLVALLVLGVCLAVLYRIAPGRGAVRTRWVSGGAGPS